MGELTGVAECLVCVAQHTLSTRLHICYLLGASQSPCVMRDYSKDVCSSLGTKIETQRSQAVCRKQYRPLTAMTSTGFPVLGSGVSHSHSGSDERMAFADRHRWFSVSFAPE